MVSTLHYITLAEMSTNPVEIMRVGQWKHPQYGDFAITENDIDMFIKHFDENVRGIEIAIDLEHGETVHAGAAAGWVKHLTRDGNRLLAEIGWTDLGKQQVETKQYRYFSPEFTFNYKDSESNKSYNNVLMGGSLTNRPFIKNMAPVLLSEDVYKETQSNTAVPSTNTENKEEHTMKFNENVIRALKLAEDAKPEVIAEAMTAFVEASVKLSEDKVALEGEIKKLNEAKTGLENTIHTLKASTTEANQDKIKLSERLALIETKLNETEWDAISTKYLSEGKMTPAMTEKFKASYFANKETTLALMETLQPVVAMGEHGSSKGESEASKTGTMKFNEAVSNIVSTDKVSYGDALVLAETRFPDLARAYRSERGIR
jgi:phage I-like protein